MLRARITKCDVYKYSWFYVERVARMRYGALFSRIAFTAMQRSTDVTLRSRVRASRIGDSPLRISCAWKTLSRVETWCGELWYARWEATNAMKFARGIQLRLGSRSIVNSASSCVLCVSTLADSQAYAFVPICVTMNLTLRETWERNCVFFFL